MERVVTPELLDQDAGTPQEIAASLADLRRINRWFGGTRVTAKLLADFAYRCGLVDLTVLDVGSGGGEVIRDTRDQLRLRGLRVHPIVLDRRRSHLDQGLPGVLADAFHLPFAAGSFDVVTCSLLAHHFSPDQFVAFLNEALRVCRRAVLINDLRRHPLHLALVYAGMPLYRSRITRHDGPASVRAAFTGREMARLIGRSQAAHYELTRHYLFRMGVVVWKA